MKALVFDLWGTLAFHQNDWNESFLWGIIHRLESFNDADIRHIVSDVYLRNDYPDIGSAVRELVKKTFHGSDKGLIVQIKTFIQNNLDNTFVYDEAAEILTALKKTYQLALLSNTDSFSVQKLPTELLDLFDSKHFSYSTGLIKPESEAFADVLSSLKIKPPEALMIGDSFRSDIQGSLSAGMHSIWMRRHKNENTTIPSISSLSELPNLIESYLCPDHCTGHSLSEQKIDKFADIKTAPLQKKLKEAPYR